jgi:hypothetical protein
MPLLLPSAKLAVLVDEKDKRKRLLRDVLFAFGILAVVIGGLDLANRVSAPQVSDETLWDAFAPAVLLTQ